MSISPSEIRTLIDWLGEAGATAGIERGHLTVSELRNIASLMKIEVAPKTTRKDIVNLLIKRASQRIDKDVQELLAMEGNELLSYFEKVRPSKSELLTILSSLDFHPGSEAQKGLYKYAARQIAETGMFQRVASNKESEKSGSSTR